MPSIQHLIVLICANQTIILRKASTYFLLTLLSRRLYTLLTRNKKSSTRSSCNRQTPTPTTTTSTSWLPYSAYSQAKESFRAGAEEIVTYRLTLPHITPPYVSLLNRVIASCGARFEWGRLITTSEPLAHFSLSLSLESCGCKLQTPLQTPSRFRFSFVARVGCVVLCSEVSEWVKIRNIRSHQLSAVLGCCFTARCGGALLLLIRLKSENYLPLERTNCKDRELLLCSLQQFSCLLLADLRWLRFELVVRWLVGLLEILWLFEWSRLRIGDRSRFAPRWMVVEAAILFLFNVMVVINSGVLIFALLWVQSSVGSWNWEKNLQIRWAKSVTFVHDHVLN